MNRMRFLAALAACLFWAVVPARADDAPLSVVELFTSQGCSSCPPADALLTRLAGRDDVLALSFHVDYWDYIGWEDPYALPDNTERQRSYARRFGRSYVYTPQIVVNGAAEVTARERGAVDDIIADARAADPVSVSMDQAPSGGITVTVGDGEEAAADVWLVYFDREHVTEVKRGENRGRSLRHSNVVRRMERIGRWEGSRLAFELPPGAMPGETCAVIVQVPATGRIIGAARL